ncbi:hypothetical protein C8A05DRAFT_30982 [Staphylotrichum tortipilum]|uniref:Uncharacterized protein n=1 Tax=Staphylotrichum tortipilum TaxID=2831512 RepID=A0AAN6MRN8_9PEZI|nr:hypothetical protein C8A05DRAFT_30982 [Staphylotrichum longicolle]
MPNAATLGFFMVAPIARIREHLERAREPGLLPQAWPRMLRGINLQASWAQDRRGSLCVLSGTEAPEETHVSPSVTEKSETLDLDTLLESFWGIGKALGWRKLYEDPAITQSISNCLSLHRQTSFLV